MLRVDNDSQKQPSLWETVLPPDLFQMNEELTQVDKLLSDECFLAPFKVKFGNDIGRPTTSPPQAGNLSANDVSEVSLSIGLRDIGERSQRQFSLETFLPSFSG